MIEPLPFAFRCRYHHFYIRLLRDSKVSWIRGQLDLFIQPHAGSHITVQLHTALAGELRSSGAGLIQLQHLGPCGRALECPSFGQNNRKIHILHLLHPSPCRQPKIPYNHKEMRQLLVIQE